MNIQKQKMHFLPEYLLNPTHPVTVCLVGCGGTGSQVLTCLARISYSLQALGHPGLYVVAYDPDTVSQSNVGRQLFCPADIGQNKALLLTTRVNAFYGTNWQAAPEYFNKETGIQCNFTLTCTDSVKSRLEVDSLLKQYARGHTYREPYMRGYYWVDFGNARDTGQVVLGSLAGIDLYRIGADIIQHRFYLSRYKRNGDRMHIRYTYCIFIYYSYNDRCSVATAGRKSFQVGLYPCSPAGVTSRNCKRNFIVFHIFN